MTDLRKYIQKGSGFLLIVNFIFACKQSGNISTEIKDSGNDGSLLLSSEQVGAIQMKYAGFSRMDIPEIVFANGMIEVPPQNQVRISPMISGYVTGIEFLEGQSVKKGDIVFYIDSKEAIDLQEKYLDLKSKYTYFENEYQRQKTLSESNISAQKVFLQSESDYQVTRASLEATRKKLIMTGINIAGLESGNILSHISIRTPIPGYMTRLHVMIGQYVRPEEMLCEVTDPSHLHVELSVFEKDASRIKTGQKFLLKVARIAAPMEGEIFMVNKKVDDEKRTVSVHGDFDAQEGIIPGMSAQAEIYVDSRPGWVLPSEAVLKGERETWIFEKADETGGVRFEPVAIGTGREFGEFIEVLENEGRFPDTTRLYAMHELYYLKSMMPGK